MLKFLTTLAITLALAAGAAQATEEDGFDPFPENRGSIYAYSQDDLPEVFFFGAGARWDGYQVMTGDWPKLTDYQKINFVEEAAEKIAAQENATVDMGDGWEILVALNGGVAAFEQADTGVRVAMIKFMRDALFEAGRIQDGPAEAVYSN